MKPASLRPHAVSFAQSLAFALASAALLLFQLGYSFETGDQQQYLLLPYRSLYPDFLPGDWFTWSTSHYHVSFAWLVRGLHALSGEAGFAFAMFIAHCANLAAVGYSILRLARALGHGVLEASFALFMFACVRQIGLGGAVLNHAGLVPADLALAPFLLACAAFCERRYWSMGSWLGLAGLLHANYTVLGPLVLFPLMALRVRSQQRRGLSMLATTATLFMLFAAPTLTLIAASFLARDPEPAAVAVTLFVRSPHHYDLAAMRWDEAFYAAVLVLLAWPELVRVARDRSRPERALLAVAFAVTLALGLLGSGLRWVTLSRLFAWRMSIPLYALLSIWSGAHLIRSLRVRNPFALGRGAAGLALCVSLAQSDPLESGIWLHAPLMAAGALAAFALATLVLPYSRLQLRVAGIAAAATAAGLAWQVAHTPPTAQAGPARRLLHFLDGRIEIQPRVRELYARIRSSTPPDARFLVPPGQSPFRLQARRAIFVDWKCAPMKGIEALEWKRRMLLATGSSTFPAQGYALPRAADALYFARPLRELVALAEREDLTHLLVRRSNLAEAPPNVRVLFAVGPYAVLERVR